MSKVKNFKKFLESYSEDVETLLEEDKEFALIKGDDIIRGFDDIYETFEHLADLLIKDRQMGLAEKDEMLQNVKELLGINGYNPIQDNIDIILNKILDRYNIIEPYNIKHKFELEDTPIDDSIELLENYDLANKIIRNNKSDKKLMNFSDKLNSVLTINKKSGYFGFILKLVVNSNLENKYELTIDSMYDLLGNNVKLNKPLHEIETLEEFIEEVENTILNVQVNKVLKNRIPNSRIRKEIKNDFSKFKKLKDLVKGGKYDYDNIGGKIKNIKSADEYLDYISKSENNLRGLQEKKNVYKIFEENDDYIFYHQMVWDDDLTFNNSNWCNTHKTWWDSYTKTGYKFIYLLFKNNLKTSLVATIKNNIVELYDYKDRFVLKYDLDKKRIISKSNDNINSETFLKLINKYIQKLN